MPRTAARAPASSKDAKKPFQVRADLDFENSKDRWEWNEAEVASPKEAEELIGDREEQIGRWLESPISFYKGNSEQPEFCRKEHLPQTRRSESSWGKIVQYAFYSADNFVLGLCTDKDHVVRTQLLLLYCAEDRKVYSVKYFYRAQDWIKDPVATCRRLTKPS